LSSFEKFGGTWRILFGDFKRNRIQPLTLLNIQMSPYFILVSSYPSGTLRQTVLFVIKLDKSHHHDTFRTPLRLFDVLRCLNNYVVPLGLKGRKIYQNFFTPKTSRKDAHIIQLWTMQSSYFASLSANKIFFVIY